MINHHLRPQRLILLFALMATAGIAPAGEKANAYQATLVWGTNDPQPSDSKLKPVDAAVAHKLAKLPFKWAHYYSVECKEFFVEPGKQKKVSMSEECEILVKAIDQETVELALRGKGQPVGKVTQKLTGKQMLVTGGNAENFTAWFVVLRRVNED